MAPQRYLSDHGFNEGSFTEGTHMSTTTWDDLDVATTTWLRTHVASTTAIPPMLSKSSTFSPVTLAPMPHSHDLCPTLGVVLGVLIAEIIVQVVSGVVSWKA